MRFCYVRRQALVQIILGLYIRSAKSVYVSYITDGSSSRAFVFIVVTAHDPDIALAQTSGIILYSIGATLFWLGSCWLLAAKHYTAEHRARTQK